MEVNGSERLGSGAGPVTVWTHGGVVLDEGMQAALNAISGLTDPITVLFREDVERGSGFVDNTPGRRLLIVPPTMRATLEEIEAGGELGHKLRLEPPGEVWVDTRDAARRSGAVG